MANFLADPTQHTDRQQQAPCTIRSAPSGSKAQLALDDAKHAQDPEPKNQKQAINRHIARKAESETCLSNCVHQSLT